MPVFIWAFIMVMIVLPVVADATTYYADPAGGGAASCVDSGANVCTLARAITVASTGDTIVAANGAYDLGASALAVNKNVTIGPVTALGASITSSNATATVDLTASNDANTLTFGAFEVRNTGGAGQIVRIVSAAYDATVTISGASIPAAGSNRHISDAWVRGTVNIVNVSLGGTLGAQAGFYSVTTPTSAKVISVSGMTGTLTASASNTPIVYIERTAGVAVAETVSVSNCNISVTVPVELGTSALGIGVRFNRIDNALAENNTISVSTLGATGVDALGLVNSSTDATATANSTVFRNNVVACNGPATRCVGIGTDGVTTFNAANARIYGNTVSNTYYNGSSTSHGVHCGRVVNCTVYSNRVNGFAVGALASISTNAIFSGNVIVGSSYAPLFAKGNTSALFVNNTAIMDDSLYGARFGGYGCLGVASQSGTNNAATTFKNNLCYVRNGTSWAHVVVDASQVASFDANDYYSDVSLSGNPWSYQGSATSALPTWNGNATVGTDLAIAPSLVSAIDFRTNGNSEIRRIGIPDNNCIDNRGRPCWQTPDIGAYQATSGDAANTRTER